MIFHPIESTLDVTVTKTDPCLICASASVHERLAVEVWRGIA